MKRFVLTAATLSAALSALTLSAALAAPVIGRVLQSSGKVTISRGRQAIAPRAREEISWDDMIEGEAGAKASIWLPRQEIVLHGPFRIFIEKSSTHLDVGIVRLQEGEIRMRTRNLSTDGKSIPVLKTKTATVGVRTNADFVAAYRPLFEETDLISLDREPDLTATANPTARAVTPGAWAGIGGRFGATVRPPVTMAPDVLRHFRELLPLP